MVLQERAVASSLRRDGAGGIGRRRRASLVEQPFSPVPRSTRMRTRQACKGPDWVMSWVAALPLLVCYVFPTLSIFTIRQKRPGVP